MTGPRAWGGIGRLNPPGITSLRAAEADYFDPKAAEAMAASMLEAFAPKSVVGVGGGMNALLNALGGFPYKTERRDNREKFSGKTYDLAISFESTKHSSRRSSVKFVGLLSRLAPVIVMTTHDPLYWIGRFNHVGFALDTYSSTYLAQMWERAGITYGGNAMAFRHVCDALT